MKLDKLKIGINQNRIVWGDVKFPEISQFNGKMVVFCHGFKGFKDWGAWNLVADQFVNAGMAFFKFNFSHNGIGDEVGLDFKDLEGFSLNTYSKELKDVSLVINYIQNELPAICSEYLVENIYLIGHSRGGGIAATYSSENSIIEKLATWASISQFNRFGSQADIDQWKAKGVKHVLNGRTGQNMPMRYEIYQDFIANQSRLNIEKCVKDLKQELLIIHGEHDNAVGYSHALRLNKWANNSNLIQVKNANHVFNAKHPFNEQKLPKELQLVVDSTINFFLS